MSASASRRWVSCSPGLMYGLGVVPAKAFTGNPIGAPIYRLLKNRYYIDELYGLIIKYVVLGLSQGLLPLR